MPQIILRIMTQIMTQIMTNSHLDKKHTFLASLFMSLYQYLSNKYLCFHPLQFLHNRFQGSFLSTYAESDRFRVFTAWKWPQNKFQPNPSKTVYSSVIQPKNTLWRGKNCTKVAFLCPSEFFFFCTFLFLLILHVSLLGSHTVYFGSLVASLIHFREAYSQYRTTIS